MTGHRALLALRLRGYKPTSCHVFALDQPTVYRWEWEQPESFMENGFLPEIHINPDESIATLDLRCLHGMIVHIVADPPERAQALFRHLCQFRPARMAAQTGDAFMYYSPQTGGIDLNAQQGIAA